jgi:hypothetical protein
MICYFAPVSAFRVRRAKAALSSGCKPHPAIAPAGSNRSSYGGNEVAEAQYLETSKAELHKAVLGAIADRATRESSGGVPINRTRRHGGPLGQCTQEQCPLIQLSGPQAYSTL